MLRHLGLLGALALAACSAGTPAPAPTPAPPATAGPASVAGTVTVAGTKGLIIAELAYSSAATAVRRAAEVGLVRPGSPLAGQLRRLNATAARSLELARTARSTADQAARVAEALSAIADLGQATPAPAGGQ